MSCLNYVFVYVFRQVIRSAGNFYFVGLLLQTVFCDNLQTNLGAFLR